MPARATRRIVFSIVFSRQRSPALLFFKFTKIETNFLPANSILEFSHSQGQKETLVQRAEIEPWAGATYSIVRADAGVRHGAGRLRCSPRAHFLRRVQHSESDLLYCEIFLRHKTLPCSAFLLRCHSGSTSLRLGLHQTDLSHIGADRLAGDLQLICRRGARSSEEDQHEQGSFHQRCFLKGHMPSAIAPCKQLPPATFGSN